MYYTRCNFHMSMMICCLDYMNLKNSEDTYKKISMPALNVARKNRHTVFGGFSLICEKINRTTQQVADFTKLKPV